VPTPWVALAVEGRLLDDARDLGQEGFIAVARFGAAAGRRPQAEGPPSPLVEGRPRQAPCPKHPRGARRTAPWTPTGHSSSIRPPPQKRLLVLYPPDALAQELIPYGQFGDDSLLPRPCFSTRSSCRILRPSAPAARKASRHSLRVVAVTPYLRLVDSRSAPGSSSRTTLALRLADQRPLPPRPVSGPAPPTSGADSAEPEIHAFVLETIHSLYRKSLSDEIVLRQISIR
jgi:hypothetical protein